MRSLRLLIVIVAAALIASCSSRKTVIKATPEYTTAAPKPTPPQAEAKIEPNAEPGTPEPTRRLLAEAEGWLGTPYRYGSREKGRGVDCSGFVMQVYSNALGIKLPRNSAEQQQWCTPLRKHDDLETGDLIFFTARKGKGGVSHVGIYIGEGNVIHASTSRGVIVQPLDDPYLDARYHSAGRVDPYRRLLAAAPKQTGQPAEKPTVIPAAKPEEAPKPAPEPTAKPMPKPAEPPVKAANAADARRLLLQRLATDTIK